MICVCHFQLALVWRDRGVGLTPSHLAVKVSTDVLRKSCAAPLGAVFILSGHLVMSPEPLDAFSYPKRQDFCIRRSPPSRLG